MSVKLNLGGNGYSSNQSQQELHPGSFSRQSDSGKLWGGFSFLAQLVIKLICQQNHLEIDSCWLQISVLS